MGDIGDKFFSHFINLRLFFDVPLKLDIGGLQFPDGVSQFVGQDIHAVAECADFLCRVFGIFVLSLKIQVGHLFREL